VIEFLNALGEALSPFLPVEVVRLLLVILAFLWTETLG